ncbi:MAG: endonuclease III [Candidatus Nanoarchaeia archaeon]
MKKVKIEKIYKILKSFSESAQAPVKEIKKVQAVNPYKILISGILSTRTKDETTISACKRLFSKVKNIVSLGKLSTKEIEQLIYPVGFYMTKAKNLKKLSKIIQKDFKGKIPNTIEKLLKLPGVGRKVANLVLSVAFKKPAICVDTHVHRIMNRLGYIKTKSPLETEMALRKKLPKKYWRKINYFLVFLGQSICTPKFPKCEECPIKKYCNKIGLN